MNCCCALARRVDERAAIRKLSHYLSRAPYSLGPQGWCCAADPEAAVTQKALAQEITTCGGVTCMARSTACVRSLGELEARYQARTRLRLLYGGRLRPVRAKPASQLLVSFPRINSSASRYSFCSVALGGGERKEPPFPGWLCCVSAALLLHAHTTSLPPRLSFYFSTLFFPEESCQYV